MEVEIATLLFADSPRTAGTSREHVANIAAAQSRLPPIIVHRPTMRVIDGYHRVQAAISNGQSVIAAKFFDGSEADAFALAVQSNIEHGLPLSLADRKRAARRIIGSHPQWSDRRIASVTGISAGTVASIRRETAQGPDGQQRMGRDGRVRPTDGIGRRKLASELVTADPSLSLREVAKLAGISPETVRDVRKRLDRGEDPCPTSRRSGRSRRPVSEADPAAERIDERSHRWPTTQREVRVMKRLQSDPALRLNECGRSLLRLLNTVLMDAEEWERITNNVPPHCRMTVSQLARSCAEIWQVLATKMEQSAEGID